MRSFKSALVNYLMKCVAFYNDIVCRQDKKSLDKTHFALFGLSIDITSKVRLFY